MGTSSTSRSPRTPLIRLRQLRAGYGDVPILGGLDLDLFGGSMVGLIGPNGAGKSTLLKALMGLLRPLSGEIQVIDQPLAAYRRNVLARHMTLVPQETQIGFAFDVEDIVAMGRNPYLGRFRVPGADDLAKIRDAMAQTGVQGLAHRPINTLSGGERQRVFIARAIAQDTPIVLLDEVTANLDLCHQLEVLELVSRLAQSGRLVIAAIHDLAMASRFCDRLLLLADGSVRADGAPRSVLTEDHLRRYFNVVARIAEVPDGRGLRIEPLAPSAAIAS